MAQLPLPPPVPSKDSLQDRWFVLLWKRVNSAGQLLWSYLDFGGSDLADLEKRSYHDLQDKPPIPVFLHDDDSGDGFVMPGPAGKDGKDGAPGVPGMDGEDAGEYPAPWEGIRTTSAFQGITTENGVANREDSTISFDDATRTFTISPVGAYFEVWSYGNRVLVKSPQSVAIDDVEGLWSFFFDASGALSAQPGFDLSLILDKAFISLVYWDADNDKAILVMDERHGRAMDSQTHLYLHTTRKAVYGNGLGLNDFVADGNGDLSSHAQFSCADGTMWDEDIKHAIVGGITQVLSPVAQIPIYYKSGASGVWRRLAPGNFPLAYAQAGTRANWNEFTGAVWQLSEVGNLQFVLVHYFATNDVGANQIIGIAGQATYATAAAAQEGAQTEIASLVVSGLPTPEFVAIGTVIFQTSNTYANAPKSRIRSLSTGGNYADWRTATTVTLGGSPAVGPQGATGATGATGPVLWIEPEVPDEPLMIPGPKGESGGGLSTAWILAFAAAHG